MNSTPTLCIKRNELAVDTLTKRLVLPLETLPWKRQVAQWIPRSEAENDKQFKQIIPYALIENAANQLICYPRQGREQRIHGCWSVGVGGHVDAADAQPNDTWDQLLERALTREIMEELAPSHTAKACLLGLINEEETSVGHVHLGIVYHLRFPAQTTFSPNHELTGMQWISPHDCHNKPLEIWSELALKLLS